ncbi:unnamed protein product, partial [Effrenium voratum]
KICWKKTKTQSLEVQFTERSCTLRSWEAQSGNPKGIPLPPGRREHENHLVSLRRFLREVESKPKDFSALFPSETSQK